MDSHLRDIEHNLRAIIGPELAEITNLITSDLSEESLYRVKLPTAHTIDQPIELLSSLVARASNAYARVARYSGMASAEYKLAKGRYERKFKRERIGNNSDERDRAAMEACKEEHRQMIAAEAIKDLADSFEHSARIASESARKIFDKASAIQMAHQREERGSYREQDFNFT